MKKQRKRYTPEEKVAIACFRAAPASWSIDYALVRYLNGLWVIKRILSLVPAMTQAALPSSCPDLLGRIPG